MGSKTIKFGTNIDHAPRNAQATRLPRGQVSIQNTQHAQRLLHDWPTAGARRGAWHLDAQCADVGISRPHGRACLMVPCCQRRGHEPAPEGLKWRGARQVVEQVVHVETFDESDVSTGRGITSAWCCGSGRLPGLQFRKARRVRPRWSGSPGFRGAAQSGLCCE